MISVAMLSARVADLLGQVPSQLLPVRGGGNNQLYRVWAGDRCYALKHYSADERDRLGGEYGGLSFLTRHGVRDVPQPIAADRTARLALFEWVDGTRLPVLAPADFEQTFALIDRLDQLAAADDAVALPTIADACLTADAAFAQWQRRLTRLLPQAARDDALTDFLQQELLPFESECRARWHAWLAESGLAPTDPLPSCVRFLSPSDFGRHNMLRRADGRLCFLDFEYFGWDDAAKFSCDFTLHPGSGFSHEQRVDILRRLGGQFSRRDPGFAARVAWLLPVCGLLWCLIILNVYIPEIWQRRVLAGQEQDPILARERQLALARRFFSQLREVIHDCATL